MNETRRKDPRRARKAWSIAAALIGLLAAPSAHAQVATGTILGNVKDTTGAAVPTAIVTATNLGTQFSRSTTTDAEGQYALRLLPVGQYKLEVGLTGFKGFSQTGIALEVGRNARVDAVIEPGGVTEVVSVVADAPLVETNTAALARNVGQNEVLNLPLVNRDLYSLLSITGGVTSNENSNSLGGPEQLTTINGSQRAQVGTVNFQLDGGNNTAGLRGTGNPAPNPEAIQEFRVITNNYAAEYGRYPAGVVDIVTKSGRTSSTAPPSSSSATRASTPSAGFRPGRRLRPRTLSIATSTARRSGVRSGRTRRSSSRASPACGRRRPTIATPRWCRPRASGWAISPRPRASPAIPPPTSRSRAGSSRPHASIRLPSPSRTNTSRSPTCPTTSSRSAGPIP